MVKYKNWYLAGEPGMKDEEEKIKINYITMYSCDNCKFYYNLVFRRTFFSGDFGMLFLHHLF